MFRNPRQSIFRCIFVSSTRQICGRHTRVAYRPHIASARRAARARRSVRIPCNQTESFPPRAIER
ncbi:hypothetical protein D5R55_36010 [Burkholderia cenocepacia]|uniref:Uncharacterized protein n=1 Tax=Burkholderia cenocepacia TaxID=95486 RepID=A0A3Q9FES7_9BURK|nr:hypothetical protein D5R55_36010 [Burkholderia cenocepacia]